jgi:lysozyme
MKEKIKAVQKLLTARGYDLGKSGPGKDGVDGDAGERTWDALLKELGNNAAEAPEAPAPPPAPPAPSGARRPGKKGLDLIHSFEQCRFDAYPDPGSVDGNPWTIGWGSTGSDIKKGTRWTQAECDARFERDIAKFAEGVAKAIGDAPTTQSQFDAMVSLAYNIGLEAFKTSSVLRRHKEGSYAAAASAFSMWVKNDGKVMKGLQRRRAAEAELYKSES